MKIKEQCPQCGATHEYDGQSVRRFSIYCGCGSTSLRFDSRYAHKWIPVRHHRRPVPKDTAEKLRRMYGGGAQKGTVTGRHPTGQNVPKTGDPAPIRIKPMGETELRFIAGKEIKWPVEKVPDLVPIEDSPQKFEGHGAPDKRSPLVKRFQDVFGQD